MRREVVVDRERFKRGDFPEICVKTGAPATRRAEFAAHLPRWRRAVEPAAGSPFTALIFSWPFAVWEFFVSWFLAGVPEEVGVLPLAPGVKAKMRIRAVGEDAIVLRAHPAFVRALGEN